MAPSRDSEELDWFCPQERGILPLEGMHVPRRLMRTVLSGGYDVTSDAAFADVMDACAQPAPGREETWISPLIRSLYTALYRQGHAHSIEIWAEDGALLGGLYGVSLGGAFFGESMASRRRDVSKIALVHLVAGLRLGGYRLLDTQYTTPHLARLGGVTVPFSAYRSMLEQALAAEPFWPGDFGLSALREPIMALRRASGDSS